MTTYLMIVVILLVVYVAGVTFANDYDRVSVVGVGGFALLVAILLLGFVMDAVYYGRKAFAATSACEAGRMQARRKVLSTDVVCIPAYRTTKADTLTVQTPDLRKDTR